jgi:hypothetical protein
MIQGDNRRLHSKKKKKSSSRKGIEIPLSSSGTHYLLCFRRTGRVQGRSRIHPFIRCFLPLPRRNLLGPHDEPGPSSERRGEAKCPHWYPVNLIGALAEKDKDDAVAS